MTSPTTETVDLGSLPVPGGYFVYRETVPPRTPFALRAHDPAGGYRLSFTYAGGGSTTRSDLLHLIASARRKIFLASYFIGDREVREALYEAAERLAGGVYVISAMNDRDFTRAINEVDDQEAVDEQIERKRFEELTRHGIAVRAYEGCHAKFAVVDDRVALVSSANITTAGLDTTGENGVLIEVPADAERVARFFAILWRDSQWAMAFGDKPVVGPRPPERWPVRLPSPDQDRTGPIWTLNDQHYIKQAIADLVGSSRGELLLATYSLDGMSRRPNLLIDYVRAAVERGVRVRLLLRGRNWVPSHVTDTATLAELGVELYPCTKNHAKGVIADRERGALFSANFDARHGLDKDVELGARLDGTPALAEALRYFEHAIAERDLDYICNPTARVLAGRLYSYAVTAWPLAATLDVVATDEDWDGLRELHTGPVLFLQRHDDVLLHAARRSWRLVPSPNGSDQPARLLRHEPQRTRAADRLNEWLTAKRPADRKPALEPHGICPATIRRVHSDPRA